ncbi:hypothetical protein GCM10027261_41440 [Geodermatophilus arenarius]|uniref:Uncharacterized protein n=1 Tax=Geodermatophilus arenarius TaxID=1137990 RepID=A0ABV9LJA3_9ACTN
MSDQWQYPEPTVPVPRGTTDVVGPIAEEVADLEEDRRRLTDLEYAELGGEG